MKIQNALPVFIALCLSSTALPFHTPIEGEKGAVLKVITRWDGSSSCTGRARLKWDDMTLGWYNNLTKSGVAGHGSKAWWKDALLIDGNNEIKVPGIVFKLCFLFWSSDSAYR